MIALTCASHAVFYFTSNEFIRSLSCAVNYLEYNNHNILMLLNKTKQGCDDE